MHEFFASFTTEYVDAGRGVDGKHLLRVLYIGMVGAECLTLKGSIMSEEERNALWANVFDDVFFAFYALNAV